MTPDDGDALTAVTASVVAAAGFDVEEIQIRRGKHTRELRIVIDSDAGVDVTTAAAVSREIARQLDEYGHTILGGEAYTLQVTSPGVTRPLTELRHFRRSAGRLVTMTQTDGTTEAVRVVGVAGEEVHVLAGPTGLTPSVIPISEVVRGVVEVEFTKPPAAVTTLLAELQQALARSEATYDDSGQGRDAR